MHMFTGTAQPVDMLEFIQGRLNRIPQSYPTAAFAQNERNQGADALVHVRVVCAARVQRLIPRKRFLIFSKLVL